MSSYDKQILSGAGSTVSTGSSIVVGAGTTTSVLDSSGLAEYDKKIKEYIDSNDDTLLSDTLPVRIVMTSEDTDVTLSPNVLYVFPEMDKLNITLADITDDTIENEYHFIFTSGMTTKTSLTLPSSVNIGDLEINNDTTYEINIVENLLSYQAWGG